MRLRAWNAGLALLHAGQGVLIVVLSNSFTLPVTISFLEGPPGSDRTATDTVYDLRIGPAVAAFLFLAAIDHAAVALPGLHGWYERNLSRGQNPARWWEYSLSASLMVVLIAMLTGITELSAFIALFGVNAAMIFFGLVMERANPPGRPVDWRPFVFGSIAGAVPWIVIAMQIGYSESQSGGVPTFVFVIFVTLFLAFNSFAVNMWLHYKGVGPWKSVAFTERGYLVLSLTAKSLLAWQIFGSTLME